MMTMNVSAILNVVKVVGVAVVLTLVLMQMKSCQKEQAQLRQDLIDANADRVSLQARSQELENANNQLESALQITRESVAASNAAIESLNREREIAQEEAANQRKVLNDVERLQSIANRRTSLLERMVNRATKERFDELEEVFNGE